MVTLVVAYGIHTFSISDDVLTVTRFVSSGVGTADPSGASEVIPSVYLDSCCSIFSFLHSTFIVCRFSVGHYIVFPSSDFSKI
jgi:hypothetical protein